MPFFYAFLLAITVANACADYYLYEYDFWYIQATAMMFMTAICGLVYGCGRHRISKRETLEEQENTEAQKKLKAQQEVEREYRITRNGECINFPGKDLTVGDKIQLDQGDIVPADCAIFYTDHGSELIVDESLLTGEAEGQSKRSLGHYQGVMLSNETVVFSQSRIVSGSASCIVLAVGDNSSASVWRDSRDVEEDEEEDNDLSDEHDNVL